jgi:hypothetical protein
LLIAYFTRNVVVVSDMDFQNMVDLMLKVERIMTGFPANLLFLDAALLRTFSFAEKALADRFLNFSHV